MSLMLQLPLRLLPASSRVYRGGGGVLAGLACAAMLAVGCSGEDVSRTVSSVQKSVKKAVDTAVDATISTGPGSFEITLDPPLKTEAGLARLVPAAGERPDVLTLWSSPKMGTVDEEFPSAFLVAHGDFGEAASLAGKQLQAELYIQLKRGGTLWHSTPAKPAQLKVGKADRRSITCTLQAPEVVNAETGERKSLSGVITANFQ